MPKLQRQEVFVPLVSGTDTEGDPRLPTRGLITCKNANFTVKGSLRKRDPLFTLYGDGPTDTATALPASVVYAAPVPSSNGVVFFGESVHESIGTGGLVKQHPNTGGHGRIVDITEHNLSYQSNVSMTNRCSFDLLKSTSTGESFLVSFAPTNASDSFGQLDVVGEESGKIFHTTATTFSAASIYTNSSELNAYVFGANQTGSDLRVTLFDGANTANSTTTLATTATNWGDGDYVGIINTTHRAVWSDGTNVYNIDLETPAIKATTAITLSGASTAQNAVDVSLWDANVTLTVAMGHKTSATETVYFDIETHTVSDTGLVAIGNDTQTVAGSGADNIYPVHGSMIQINTDAGYLIYSTTETNVGVTTSMVPVDFAANSPTVDTANAQVICCGSYPVSRPFKYTGGSDWYQVWRHSGGDWWDDSLRAFDEFSVQNSMYLIRYTQDFDSFYPSTSTITPVGLFNVNHPWNNFEAYISNYRVVSRLDKNGDRFYYMGYPLMSQEVSATGETHDSQIKYMKLNADPTFVKHVLHNNKTFIPNSLPYVYDGRAMRPSGSMQYAEGLSAAAAGAGSGWGDSAGDFTYTATYVQKDSFGDEIESAPAPSITVAVVATNDNVTVTVPAPNLMERHATTYGYEKPFVRWYRTEANGNLFFMVGQSAGIGVGNNTVQIIDTGSASLSTSAGLESVFTAKSLYTNNGELANTPPRPHRVATSHQDRYVYADRSKPESDIYYSKATKPGIATEFNDVLKITCSPAGGEITGLASAWEKLWIFKKDAIYVTHGSPLNDAGAGSGFAPPRLVSREAGLAEPVAVDSGQGGIVFINRLDGGIYMIGPDEQVKFIGGPVRYYTDLKTYDHVVFHPKDHSIVVLSNTASTPSLVYDYRYGLWCTYDGRYNGGIRSAFLSSYGESYADSVPTITVMGADRKSYFSLNQANADAEDYELDVTSAWFSLNDMVGYGKIADQTLLCGIPVANTNLSIQTAYDYDPQWIDTTTIAVNTNAFDHTNHYTMAGTTFTDQTAKFCIDGSRHKTDAIRYRIRETDGTARNNLEIVGIKLDIGVKPGNTRIGDGRSYNS